MKNWAGRAYLTVAGLDAFFRSIRLEITSPLRRPIYRITNQIKCYEIKCKTSRYKNSFFPNAFSIWNKMITDFRDIPSFSSIRAHTLSLIRPKIKSTFGIHDPLGLRHLFQLIVHLTPLNQHKNAIILFILLLIFASVNMVSRLLIIISLSVLFLHLREQLWQLSHWNSTK